MWRTYIVTVTYLLNIDISSSFTFNVDMEKASVCSTLSSVRMSPYDIANIYAEPVQSSKPTRATCAVKFTSTDGTGFKIFVRDLTFGEGEVYVRVYEDLFLNTARHSFGSNDNAGGLYYTNSGEMVIRLEKPGPESHSYRFYIRVALQNGPDIGGKVGGDSDVDTAAIGAGALAGIIIASILGVAVAVAVLVYCIIVFRKKQEEKEAEMSMSTLFPPGKSDHHDGSSVHSSTHISWHSTKTPSENPAYNYPAYRTQASISEKAPKCNSLDSKSYDSEATDNTVLTDKQKPKVKSAKKELDSLRRTIFKIERNKEREKEEELRYLERERDRRGHHDYDRHGDPLLDRRDRGLTSGRQTSNRPVLNAENIKSSLRSARDKGRTFGSDNNFHRSSRAGSGRSSRSKHKARSYSPARSNASTRDSDYHSERHGHRSRPGDRERSRSGHRSSSAHSKRNRDHYDERDYHSDEESHRRRSRHRDRDAYSEYSDDDRYSHKSNRSGGHRTRSGSSGRRRR